ncbi:MAG: YjbQ family protein, partial [Desulfonatronovibrionaceae bacterium]
MISIDIQTRASTDMVDITLGVQQAVKDCGAEKGIALIYCPHTTGGITINEGADPDVCR